MRLIRLIMFSGAGPNPPPLPQNGPFEDCKTNRPLADSEEGPNLPGCATSRIGAKRAQPVVDDYGHGSRRHLEMMSRCRTRNFFCSSCMLSGRTVNHAHLD